MIQELGSMASDTNSLQTNKESSGRHFSIVNRRNNKDDSSDASSARGTFKRFNPDAIILSQCSKKSNWVDKLKWLQPRRDVGLWIQCSNRNCRKWRFANEYHDPLTVPKKWYCNMSSDPSVASCLIKEKRVSAAIKQDLIENKYNAGSLVIAQYHLYPWWPAMIDDSPETFTFYKLREGSDIPIQYHAIFFDEYELRYGWISAKSIKPFAETFDTISVKLTANLEYKNRLDIAYDLTCSAVPLSIRERLKKFSFVARYTKLNNSPNHMFIEGENDDKCRASRTVNSMISNVTKLARFDVLSSDDDEVPSSQHILDLRIQQVTKCLKSKRGY